MLQEGKLEPSEQLGDLLKQSGDADAALSCYRSAGATTKVIEGETPVPCKLMQPCVQGQLACRQGLAPAGLPGSVNRGKS